MPSERAWRTRETSAADAERLALIGERLFRVGDRNYGDVVLAKPLG